MKRVSSALLALTILCALLLTGCGQTTAADSGAAAPPGPTT